MHRSDSSSSFNIQLIRLWVEPCDVMVSGFCIFESWFHCCLTDVELLSFGFHFQTSHPSVRGLRVCYLYFLRSKLWSFTAFFVWAALKHPVSDDVNGLCFSHIKRQFGTHSSSSTENGSSEHRLLHQTLIRGTAEMSIKSNLVEGGTRAAHSPVHCYLFSSRS